MIADIPYNIGTDFYASRPDWYVDGDNKNGESDKARKAAFNTDFTFNIAEYFHFCNRLLKKEPRKGEKDAPCMIVFCAFQQIPKVITEAEKYGFKNYIPLVFCKNYSPQVLKANMKIVGATEYALSKIFKAQGKAESGLLRGADTLSDVETHTGRGFFILWKFFVVHIAMCMVLLYVLDTEIYIARRWQDEKTGMVIR